MATVKIADLVNPDSANILAQYVLEQTERKSALIQSGAVVMDSRLNGALAGSGMTFNEPSFNDLDNDAENVSSDDDTALSTPSKITSTVEVQIRLSRNKSWSAMNLAGELTKADPLAAVGDRIAHYWNEREQAAFISTVAGVFADNAAAPTATEHVLNDMTKDIKGASFVDGTTNFSTSAFIDACVTMGDSLENLRMVAVHSVVYARMLKLQLIDFVQDASNPLAERIPTYLGRRVILDDSMPATAGVYETWLFGDASVRMGRHAPMNAIETERKPSAGNGGGQDNLFSRTEMIIHPVGCKYVGATTVSGGPSNATLALAASWQRAFAERKQIKIARLITREHA